jgi:16S rRNA (guanine(966)-N(2))-methyltransferase RsmD
MTRRNRRNRAPDRARKGPLKLRIVGGTLRGRLIAYHGDPCTRPMKDRVREAVFNLLGPAVRDTLVIDLFAGTGALALEALSRGASQAVAIDRHLPSVRGIRDNAAALQVEARIEVIASDAFRWFQAAQLDPSRPWLVFCCPPYELYRTEAEALNQLVVELVSRAPDHSLLVLESDTQAELPLPAGADWDVREYPPTVIAVGENKRA